MNTKILTDFQICIKVPLKNALFIGGIEKCQWHETR